MQEIYHFLQGLLRFILPCNILEGNAGLLLHIHLGVALADSHHSAALRHLPGHPDENAYQHRNGQQGKKRLRHNGRSSIRNLLAELHACLVKTLRQGIIPDYPGIVFLGNLLPLLFLFRNHDTCTVDDDFLHLLIVYHLKEFIVTNLVIITHSLKLEQCHDHDRRNQRHQYDKR